MRNCCDTNGNIPPMWTDTDRLDKVMCGLKLVSSRTKAQSLIKQSAVTVNGTVVAKPNTVVHVCDTIKIIADPCPWVSRAGLKLDFALRHFHIPVKNRIALDIGASTGGFSQVLLQRGAQKIYAVDVGTNQLHHSLRHNPRIVRMEQTDARTLTAALVPAVDILVADVSFISLTKILSPCLARVTNGGDGIFLIKPQFEVGKKYIGKGGMVTDKTAVQNAIHTIKTFFIAHRWTVTNTVACPILGGDGSQEYFLHAKNTGIKK